MKAFHQIYFQNREDNEQMNRSLSAPLVPSSAQSPEQRSDARQAPALPAPCLPLTSQAMT